ncbi:hypothetical protein GF327_05075, partial [Candidatus Woesearchaeota archaeon]|nr:hypothetical protein [Candidatus Woesearchaeota archaeon]
MVFNKKKKIQLTSFLIIGIVAVLFIFGIFFLSRREKFNHVISADKSSVQAGMDLCMEEISKDAVTYKGALYREELEDYLTDEIKT